MAKTDHEKYIELAREFNSTVPAIQQMVADLAKVETGVDPAAGVPSLDDLDKEFGDDHDPKLFWPEVKVKVPPDVFEAYEQRMAEQSGEPHERFAALIGVKE
jgi:hypothetical protein